MTVNIGLLLEVKYFCSVVFELPGALQVKDTVTADEEDDEINTDDHPWKDGAPICHDAVIHHHVPVLTCQDLHTQ